MTAQIIQLTSRRRSDTDPERPERESTPVEIPTLGDELRRARIRILQLESSLTAALRDAVRHHDRALGLEERLQVLQRKLSDGRDPGPNQA
ncbi:MAG: hypothetical protein AAFV19_03765 [Pseudomonadota bacterium]